MRGYSAGAMVRLGLNAGRRSAAGLDREHLPGRGEVPCRLPQRTQRPQSNQRALRPNSSSPGTARDVHRLPIRSPCARRTVGDSCRRFYRCISVVLRHCFWPHPRLHAAERRRQTGFLRVCTTGPSERCEPMWQASIATDILPIVTADSGEGCGRALGGCTEGSLRL